MPGSEPRGSWFSRFLRIALGFVLAVIVLGAETEAVYALCDNDPVYYKFTFQGNFNKKSSPVSLPSPHVRFTQVVWGTHSSQVKFWNPGSMASLAVEAVAEEGETFALTNEFIDAFTGGNMALWGSFPPGRYPGGEETLSIQIKVCKEAPLFTGLTMLDLSPDWFVGLSSYSLLDSQGNYIPSRTVDLYPYDAGTEQGTEYTLNNLPSDPYQVITSIKGKGKFSGATAPVARMKFELINPVNLNIRAQGGQQTGAVNQTEGGGPITITATLGNSNTSSSALSIPIRTNSSQTTAQSGDYTVANSVSIESNTKSGTATFKVTDDSNDEPTETVVLELGSPLPAGITAGTGNRVKITINDNDATVVSLARSDTGAIAEGGAGTKENAEFTVTLGRDLVAGERIDVPLVLSGSGVTTDDLESLSKKSGGDLNTGVTLAGANTLTPTVIFQGAGASTATLILTPSDDAHTENDETLTVALGPDGSGTNGFDHSSLRTNVGGGADPHSSSKSFDVVIESEDVTAPPPKPPTPSLPSVSISGGSPVTEGGTATFTLNASPAPTASITVKVSVGESGSFARSGQTGSRSVTIGTGGRASLTVTTENDNRNEPNGSITATLAGGNGYSVGSPGSASVRVKDNDVPTVSISGGSAVTEGGTATFTLNASPAPTASITVKVSVGESGSFARSGQTGSRSVTIGTGGTGSLTIRTMDDSTDEPDGVIKVTVTSSGQSYSVSPIYYSASVTVKDNDDDLPATDNDSPPPTVPDTGDSDDEPSLDRRILVAIYNVAGGGRWTRQDNWVTGAPVTTWYGVIADLEGRVTGLILEDNNLEGGINGDIGELGKLKVLYMNNNKLEGAIPVAQLRALESLEELALWGNKGDLWGTIPDELGKKVDRAALRKIKEVNGVSVLTDWFTEDDAVFDYSGWSEVEVNGNDRISGLDLSGVGLRGYTTEAIWALSVLEELDLSDNPDLSGEIPLSVMNGRLEFLDISGTDLCIPQDEGFEQWLGSIDFTDSDSDNCVGIVTLLTSEPVPVQRSEPAQGESGGGCFVASGSGLNNGIPEFALTFFVLLLIFLAGRRGAQHRKNHGNAC
ncbi:MAG: spondin domain-containing protein [Candidatus Dadabacteria bacterium]|nr:spondin domain-containing protein [Candidatus Dadabacteria bacterium]MDE0662310.1 spondin domain-containing protein [Candidatus Dadabacteria bacterium]